jgi:flagellar biosynthesis protein FliQ
MSQDTVIQLVVSAMTVALKISLPILLVALGVGLIISVFQAVTQIQEMTLSFIPKILALGAVLVVAGPWMLNQMLAWTAELYASIPDLIG